MESGEEKVHQIIDKGYKKLFEDKNMFIEFLQTFVKDDWVQDINEDDLMRIDKEFILQDYRKKEADIVYRMKLKNEETKKELDVIFYILFELQSRVDRIMPYRLLMYMVQIWKNELFNVKHKQAQSKDFKLPSIVPMVLYNGEGKWSAVKNFRDLLSEEKRFREYLVDFKYILIDVNSYTEDELYNISNAISCIIMMDQNIVKREKEVLIRRMNKIVTLKDKIAPEKLERLIEWLTEVLSKKFKNKGIDGKLKDTITKSMKEGKEMTYAIERLFNDIEKEAMEKGRKEGIEKGIEEMRIAIAKEMIIEGESLDKIIKYSKLSKEKIDKLKNEIN
ncbi:UNVERIFIED_CONTAM: putative transposase/invertase (TIGR01784 family) [Acetivibrio alkalicellulosi]